MTTQSDSAMAITFGGTCLPSGRGKWAGTYRTKLEGVTATEK
ncbi:hypothetical protein [Levilactobacillus brevis]|uniref:Uncharacterized protein n=1 Tax=Levilactobacillus brevis TaxID=1580 RepID=A0A5B7XY24_LEVBR|nr:hypothetical protein [Levilactobacillus brevis]KIO94878.1 hypothetical protein N624_0992 [Levilactobacillus brevis]KIO97041.1 hypothetical protein N627_2013 [Levilactobacillus brevis]QCZ52501.1 hypothetical protein UCCLBBS449_0521 [Levilactobacillus brevis]